MSITIERKFWTQQITEDGTAYVAIIRADVPEGYFSWPKDQKMEWIRENDIHQFFLNKQGEWQEYQGYDEIDPLLIPVSDSPRANLKGVDLNGG